MGGLGTPASGQDGCSITVTLHSLASSYPGRVLYLLSNLYGKSTALLRSEDFRPEKARFLSRLDSVAFREVLIRLYLPTHTFLPLYLHDSIIHFTASIAAVGLGSSPDSRPALYGSVREAYVRYETTTYR